MSRYEVRVIWYEGATQTEIITGNLTMGNNYYQIVDEDFKDWFFPMGRTVIQEL